MNSPPPTEPEVLKSSSDDDSKKKNIIFQEWLSQRSNNIIPDFSNTIHGGHVLLATSLAFGFLAYRDYHRPLDDVIQKALVLRSKHGNEAKNAAINRHYPPLVVKSSIEAAASNSCSAADEALRRTIGSITAVRALRVATLTTTSAFALTGALSLYVTGCTTFQEFFVLTRTWAYTQRQALDTMLGIDQRVHRDQHPDIAAIQGMTEEQELDYVYKTYFPQDEEMVDGDPSPGCAPAK
jgi:hypothetical protein